MGFKSFGDLVIIMICALLFSKLCSRKFPNGSIKSLLIGFEKSIKRIDRPGSLFCAEKHHLIELHQDF
jgi:hypothetical protein